MENDDKPTRYKKRNDNIYNNGGDQLLLTVTGDDTNGYTSAINIGIDLTDLEVGAADTMGQGGPGCPGGGPPP